jgi:hypothetical protein
VKLNIVPARTGILWVRLGVHAFFRQPLALTGLFFLYMVAVSLLAVLPFVGPVLSLAVVPAATLGFMAATRQVSEGRFPLPTVLLTAFRTGQQRFRAMLALGCFFAAAVFAIQLIVNLLVELPPLPDKADSRTLVLMPEFRTMMALTLALSTPVSLVFWHAPALVHWHGVSPVKSLFFSTVAIVRNMGAMTVYGAVWMGLMLAGALVLSLLQIVSVFLASALLMPYVLIMSTMFFASIYFTFRDSFLADDPPSPTQETPDE